MRKQSSIKTWNDNFRVCSIWISSWQRLQIIIYQSACLAQACGEVLCVIKFTKNLLFNPAEICISGIRCNFDNIAKISTIFDFKWTEVTIDSVKEGSSLLEFVKVQGLKNFIRHHSSGNIEMSVVVPCHLFEVFLDKAIKENPENIFMLIYLNLQVTYVYSNLLKNW